MSARLRLVDTGSRPARWNVAASAALLRHVDEGRAPDTLRFHAYPLSAILGRNQDAAAELDIAACRRAGIEVARRVTGGGAVVMGPGVIAWDLVLAARSADPRAIGDRLALALVDALARLGLDAIQATPGSVEVGGRKVSGSAGRRGARAVLHQATLIVDLAAAAPLSLLRRRTEAGRPTADPRHRVTSLAEALGTAPAEAEVKAALAGAFASALGRALEPGELEASELTLTETLLADELGRDDFVLVDALSFRGSRSESPEPIQADACKATQTSGEAALRPRQPLWVPGSAPPPQNDGPGSDPLRSAA